MDAKKIMEYLTQIEKEVKLRAYQINSEIRHIFVLADDYAPVIASLKKMDVPVMSKNCEFITQTGIYSDNISLLINSEEFMMDIICSDNQLSCYGVYEPSLDYRLNKPYSRKEYLGNSDAIFGLVTIKDDDIGFQLYEVPNKDVFMDTLGEINVFLKYNDYPIKPKSEIQQIRWA